ncbi:transglutaminase family protein [Novosphingobium sp. KCTC 2891]|uniref:transglutaminase family protein n=1 Tax=Novosphingobium sp. KCTC 2891 TaxID=2989730 RepID=UPI002223C2A3|nr:transglutaminase family protein [Novosphingobium sp. KCTC 2891]MCW1382503.1 transglutaminase family protein [Novosphingobium sp. KCTC 2891]
MRLAIDHTTHYRFSGPVSRGQQRLRLKPKESAGQSVLEWAIHLDGARCEVEYDDENSNHVTLISFEPGTTEVTIRCEGVVETSDVAGIIGRHAGYLPRWHFLQQTDLTAPGPRLRALAASLDSTGDALTKLHALSSLVRETIAYELGYTDAATTAEAALADGRGVCQDHAHVFIGAARLLGIPARYVSGYLMMNDRVEQNAGHAWAEAMVEGLGWVGFDVSNGICPDVRYVRVATGRDYRDAAPITGIRTGARDETMHVKLAVEQQRVEQ